MDADIVEIPPLIHLLKKQKRAILHDVIDIDDDSEDLVIIGEKVSKNNKGKTIEVIHQVVKCLLVLVQKTMVWLAIQRPGSCYMQAIHQLAPNLKVLRSHLAVAAHAFQISNMKL